MSVNGIGAGYPAWRDMGKAQRHGSGTGFANRMADADAEGSGSSARNSVRTAGQTSVLDAYRASAASGVRNVKPAYDTYESENYRIVPDNEAGCFDIYNKYPNLIHDKNAAYIWADLEIKGLAQHTKDGIVSMGFNGMSYNDNADYKNNWSVLFSGDTYKAVFDWLQNNRGSIEEMQKFATWQDVFNNIGSRYDRIWSDEEEKQGYLNN